MEVAKNRGNLTVDEHLLLTQQYDTLCSQFDLNPDLIIYLRIDPVTAYERMTSRGRIEESSARLSKLFQPLRLSIHVSMHGCMGHISAFHSFASSR